MDNKKVLLAELATEIEFLRTKFARRNVSERIGSFAIYLENLLIDGIPLGDGYPRRKITGSSRAFVQELAGLLNDWNRETDAKSWR